VTGLPRDPVTALRSVPGCHHKPTILDMAVYDFKIN